MKYNLIDETKDTYQKQIAKSAKLVGKWAKTGLLDGLKNEFEKHSMAVMLENQARQLLDEVSKTGSANAEEWSGVALPLVRRIFAQLSAKEFVSVQPMNLPSGLVFFLEFKYATAQPGFQTSEGTSLQDNSLMGVTNQANTDPTEGLYGAGRFGYSINEYTTTPTGVTGSITWDDINYSSDLSASMSDGTMYRVTVDMNGLNHDTNGIRAFYISGSGINAYYPAYTANLDSARGASTRYVTFVVSGSGITGSQTVKYHKQPTSSTRGDFEASGDPAYTDLLSTNALDIPEINIGLRSEGIIAKTRKLKAVWTPEFAQDLSAYHSVDAENELTSILGEYISMEMDLELLDMLIVNAATTAYWSAQIGTVRTAANTFAVQDNIQGYALAYNQMSWFQTIGVKLTDISNQIHAKTLRGGANFMVISPKISTIIESIPGYAPDTTGGEMKYAMGVQKIGMVNNKFNVFKNPYMKENLALMGFRGTQFLETGAVYAPYIPLIMTPLIYDPTNLTPRKGIMSRYAKKILRPEFYGKLIVTHLNYV
jgi:hypothetical protein